MAKKFPKTLYVKRESDGASSEFFIADEDREALAEKGSRLRIAVYELVEVQEVETRTICVGASKS